MRRNTPPLTGLGRLKPPNGLPGIATAALLLVSANGPAPAQAAPERRRQRCGPATRRCRAASCRVLRLFHPGEQVTRSSGCCQEAVAAAKPGIKWSTIEGDDRRRRCRPWKLQAERGYIAGTALARSAQLLQRAREEGRRYRSARSSGVASLKPARSCRQLPVSHTGAVRRCATRYLAKCGSRARSIKAGLSHNFCRGTVFYSGLCADDAVLPPKKRSCRR